MRDPVLSIKNLSLNAGEKKILRNVDFELPERSVTALMGPMGGGKSTFLKFLAGESVGEGIQASYDQALYRGRMMGKFGNPLFIRQKTRESAATPEESRALMTQRIAELNAVCRGNSDTICIDEPTAGLMEGHGEMLMERIREAASERSVLIVSHNKEQVQAYCDQVALFGAGRLLEFTSREAFFAAEEGTHPGYFLRTGGVDLPQEELPVHMLSPQHRPLPQEFDTAPASRGEPTWIIQELLDVLPRADIDEVGHVVLAFTEDTVVLQSQESRMLDLPWHGGYNRPELDRAMLVRICRTLDGMLREGTRVSIASARNMPAAAALVGALMVLRGSAPDKAGELTALKFPDILLGMRIEQLFWDLDMDFSEV